MGKFSSQFSKSSSSSNNQTRTQRLVNQQETNKVYLTPEEQQYNSSRNKIVSRINSIDNELNQLNQEYQKVLQLRTEGGRNLTQTERNIKYKIEALSGERAVWEEGLTLSREETINQVETGYIGQKANQVKQSIQYATSSSRQEEAKRYKDAKIKYEEDYKKAKEEQELAYKEYRKNLDQQIKAGNINQVKISYDPEKRTETFDYKSAKPSLIFQYKSTAEDFRNKLLADEQFKSMIEGREFSYYFESPEEEKRLEEQRIKNAESFLIEQKAVKNEEEFFKSIKEGTPFFKTITNSVELQNIIDKAPEELKYDVYEKGLTQLNQYEDFVSKKDANKNQFTFSKEFKKNLEGKGSKSFTSAVDVGVGQIQDFKFEVTDGKVISWQPLGQAQEKRYPYADTIKPSVLFTPRSEMEKTIGGRYKLLDMNKYDSLFSLLSFVDFGMDETARAISKIPFEKFNLPFDPYRVDVVKKKAVYDEYGQVILPEVSYTIPRAELEQSSYQVLKPAVEIATYVSPAGMPLLILEGTEALGTKKGRKRTFEEGLSISQTYNLPNWVGVGGAFTLKGLELGLGTYSLAKSIKVARYKELANVPFKSPTGDKSLVKVYKIGNKPEQYMVGFEGYKQIGGQDLFRFGDKSLKLPTTRATTYQYNLLTRIPKSNSFLIEGGRGTTSVKTQKLFRKYVTKEYPFTFGGLGKDTLGRKITKSQLERLGLGQRVKKQRITLEYGKAREGGVLPKDSLWRGEFNPEEHRIYLREGLSKSVAKKVKLHEQGHSFEYWSSKIVDDLSQDEFNKLMDFSNKYIASKYGGKVPKVYEGVYGGRVRQYPKTISETLADAYRGKVPKYNLDVIDKIILKNKKAFTGITQVRSIATGKKTTSLFGTKLIKQKGFKGTVRTGKVKLITNYEDTVKGLIPFKESEKVSVQVLGKGRGERYFESLTEEVKRRSLKYQDTLLKTKIKKGGIKIQKRVKTSLETIGRMPPRESKYAMLGGDPILMEKVKRVITPATPERTVFFGDLGSSGGSPSRLPIFFNNNPDISSIDLSRFGYTTQVANANLNLIIPKNAWTWKVPSIQIEQNKLRVDSVNKALNKLKNLDKLSPAQPQTPIDKFDTPERFDTGQGLREQLIEKQVFEVPPIITPNIPIPKPKIPFALLPFMTFEGAKAKNKKFKKGKRITELGYFPDFTSRVLDLDPKVLRIKDVEKEIRKIRTGLEIRRGIKIRY